MQDNISSLPLKKSHLTSTVIEGILDAHHLLARSKPFSLPAYPRNDNPEYSHYDCYAYPLQGLGHDLFLKDALSYLADKREAAGNRRVGLSNNFSVNFHKRLSRPLENYSSIVK